MTEATIKTGIEKAKSGDLQAALSRDVLEALVILKSAPDTFGVYLTLVSELVGAHTSLTKRDVESWMKTTCSEHTSKSYEPYELNDSSASRVNNPSTTLRSKGNNPATRAEMLGQNEIGKEVADKLQHKLAWDSTAGIWFKRTAISEPYKGCDDPLDAWQTINGACTDYKDRFSSGFVSGVEMFVKAELRLAYWQNDRNLLPMANGVLRLDTKELRNYTDQDRFNWQLPYRYNPAATCPLIDTTIKRMVGDDAELGRFLMAWLVVVLLGRADVQAFAELIGEGGTGKSTFLRIATFLVGEENVISTDLESLEGNRFETANIYGKRLALVSDSARYRGDVPVLKALTGGDPVRLERKNLQQGRPYKYEGLLMIAANQPLESTDYSSGLQRRRRSVRIDGRVTEQEKKPYRDKKKFPDGFEGALREQMPGLLVKLLTLDVGEQVSLIAEPSAAMKRQRLNVELETNPLLAWSDECLVRFDGSESSAIDHGYIIQIGNMKLLPSGALYPSYVEFCQSRGNRPRSLTKFSADLADGLRDYGIDTKKHRGKCTHMMGLRLRGVTEQYENVPRLLSDTSVVVDSNDAIVEFVGSVGKKPSVVFGDSANVRVVSSSDPSQPIYPEESEKAEYQNGGGKL